MISFKICSQQFLSDRISKGKLHSFAVCIFLIRGTKKAVTDVASTVKLFLTFLVNILIFLRIYLHSWMNTAKSTALLGLQWSSEHPSVAEHCCYKSRFTLKRAILIAHTWFCLQRSSNVWVYKTIPSVKDLIYMGLHMFNLGTWFMYLPEQYRFLLHYMYASVCVYVCICVCVIYMCIYLYIFI